MKRRDRLGQAMLRWDRLLALAALALPFVAAMLAGFAWMYDNGWLIGFIVASISLGGAVTALRLGVAWWRRRRTPDPAAATAPPPPKLSARIDPDWSPPERAAFETARAYIDSQTAAPLPWDQLRPVAEQVVRLVANGSGRQGKGVLDFTVPEALLLADRVTVRLRADIRDHVPFADSISVGTLVWLWDHRATVRKMGVHGYNAWRVLRAIKSLPIAILREIEGAIAEGHASFVTGEGTAIVQALLLEEVAAAAVDLYSGRLRFSDAELLELRRASGDQDRARLAGPDAPLRIAVAGQVSAGKSSLINALLSADLAETDVIPTTEQAQTYATDIDGVAAVLLDLPGLDGAAAVAQAVEKQLHDADMVLWCVRANRPAREIDRAALARFRQQFDQRPERRMPPVIVVVTCIDRILDGWPFPEHLLNDAAMERVREITAAVAGDLGTVRTHPVPVVLTPPDWNLDTLHDRIEAQLAEALMAQRNRLRVEARTSGLRTEAGRAGRGLRKGLWLFGGGGKATPAKADTVTGGGDTP